MTLLSKYSLQKKEPRNYLRQVEQLLLLLTCLLLADMVFGEMSFPKLSGRVVDEAGLLSPQTEAKLSQQLQALEQQTGHQFVVVTLKSLQDYPIEEYGYQLGRHWAVGKKEKDDGILLIVAPNERKVRIEVGYGLEGVITDALSSNIVNAVVLPEFKRSRVEEGIILGTDAIFAALDGKYQLKPTRQPAKSGKSSNIIPLVFILFIILMNLFGGGGRRRGFHRGGFYGGFGGGGFSGGGSSGSGGFSGGGGSFGGGGASGSW